MINDWYSLKLEKLGKITIYYIIWPRNNSNLWFYSTKNMASSSKKSKLSWGLKLSHQDCTTMIKDLGSMSVSDEDSTMVDDITVAKTSSTKKSKKYKAAEPKVSTSDLVGQAFQVTMIRMLTDPPPYTNFQLKRHYTGKDTLHIILAIIFTLCLSVLYFLEWSETQPDQ